MADELHVADDLYCVRCGYNLRTLPWTAKCSECGTGVEESRGAPNLGGATLRQLRGLRTGLLLLALAIGLESLLIVDGLFEFIPIGDSWIYIIYPILSFAGPVILMRCALRSRIRRTIAFGLLLITLVRFGVWALALAGYNSSGSLGEMAYTVIVFFLPINYLFRSAIPFLVILWLGGLFGSRKTPHIRLPLWIGFIAGLYAVAAYVIDVVQHDDRVWGLLGVMDPGWDGFLGCSREIAILLILGVLFVLRARIPSIRGVNDRRECSGLNHK